MELFYLLNVFSLASVVGFAGWLVVVVLRPSSSRVPVRRLSRQRSRASMDSQSSDQVYLDSNLEITNSQFFDESDDESMDDFQSVAGSRRVSFADRIYDISSSVATTSEKRRLSCIDLKNSDNGSSRYNLFQENNGLRRRGKMGRSESDPGHDSWIQDKYKLPPLINVTPCAENELSFAEESTDQREKNDVNNETMNPHIVEEYLSQHSTGMPRKLSDQRRGSFLYRNEPDTSLSSSRGLSRTSSMSSIQNDKNGLDDIIVTPFAQILARLREVRHMMNRLTALPTDENNEDDRRLTGVEQQQQLLDGLADIDWVLEHLNKIKARNSVGEMAQNKFKRMLTRELSQFSETSRSGNQVAEWVTNTYFERGEDELELEKSKNRIPAIYAKRIIHQASQVLKGNVPKYGVEVEDDDAMGMMVAQINTWNFDMFKFSTISKDHPLVSMAYIILQSERNLLRSYNIDPATFIKYMFVIEANYHTNNPYHNATHGADVMQSCHVLLGYSVVEQVFTDLEVFAALYACAIHDVDHPGLSNQFLSNTSNALAILYNDHAVLENHHLATAFKFLKEDELNWASGMDDKQRSLFRKMVIDLVLATDMSKHLSLLADIKTTVESSKVAHHGKLVLESYNERMLVLQGIVHSCDISSATKALPIYKAWTEKIIEEFYQQGDRERELGLNLSPMCDRQDPSIEKSQVGFIDYIVLPLWETLGELMFPYCQEMLTQLNENRMYYFSRIPESPRCSITDSPESDDRSDLIASSEKRKNMRVTVNKADDCSDLSSIDEGMKQQTIQIEVILT
ncbi:3',5'-cyclic-AMP phosphodiesterase 4C-like isoform X3 [Bolinopsis microptera]|uniref:3',5'-cyclic-AMP phosphodiesterase 4C-like isoform X3 n=1 Tax=Bolinopsis microptera TaxID=2820187 RepID=UPI003078C48C